MNGDAELIHWGRHLRYLVEQKRDWLEQAEAYRFQGKYEMQAMAIRNAEHYANELTKATAKQLGDPARTGESGQGIPDDAA